MNIFVKIKNSIYNPKYYSEVLEKSFSYSLKYYLVFALLFALVFTIIVTTKFIPTEQFLADQSSKLTGYFPQDLTLNIKDGKISDNVQEPYFIKLPEVFKNGQNVKPSAANLENAVVIDTKDKFDLDKFYSYKTFMLVTSDSIVYINNNNQVAINSVSGAKNFTLNREEVSRLVSTVRPYLNFLYPIVFVIAYIAGFLAVLLTLVCLLFEALLVWLVAKIKGLKIGYKKSFQASMHLMAGAVIITSILDLVLPKFKFPFLFTILIVLFALLNLRKGALDTFEKKE